MTAGVLGAPATSPRERPGWMSAPLGYALLAVLAYVPPLLTHPGKVVADTKSYFYLDPSRLLDRAPSMWDPNIGMGTVTHQNIGYLFPMGPYYWLCERIGLPDWVAQRLWLGTLMFTAACGLLYLCRALALRGPGVVVAALAYAFSPYALHYASRISVILLPWAGLGFALGFTIKALRDGGWRYPALFALWVQIVGSVNATALIFAGIAPVAWVLYATFVTRESSWRRSLATTLKIGVLTIAASLWWIAGLSLQGGYGLNILRFTETVRAVARTSAPNEILRGLGYWFFYGQDRIGPWIEAAENYTQRPAIILIGYGLACLALLSAAVVRWRHRAFFVLLALVGVVIGVGAHPYDDPTPLGAVFKSFANSSTAGLALRSTGRAIPLVVLSFSVLLGVGVNAAYNALVRVRRPLLGGAIVVVVGGLVLANFPALYDGTYYGKGLERPEDIPQYWHDATAYLDDGNQQPQTRVLELPGSDFASYRWGSTVDPITPGLMDRPYVARELIPYGTPGTADLLNAFDRRIQEGVSDPAGFAAVLRRMGVGDVVLRYDLQHERYNLVRPEILQRTFTPPPVGIEKGPTFGTEPAGPPAANFQDELDLGAPANEPSAPALQDYRIDDPLPIVRAEPAGGAVVISGNGEGLVDAAEIGLLTDAGVVVYSASYDDEPDELRQVLGDDGVLVLTDSNRRRGRRWSTVRENVGETEPRGSDPYVEDPSNAQLDLFPDQSEDAYTAVDQVGVKRVVASSYGNPISYTPEDRAARAFDGNLGTAWRAKAFDEAIGEKLRVETTEPITTDRINLVQPLNGPRDRFITQVRLTFDGEQPVEANLSASSRTPTGQTVLFPRRTFSTLEIEITDLNVGRRLLHTGASAVGFAEVRLRDEDASSNLRVNEIVDMPRDMLSALGDDSLSHPLVISMTRERVLPVPPRTDPERNLARRFVLPTARGFSLTGTARISPEAEHAQINRALGVPTLEEGGVDTDASEFLAGCVECRADNAIDGDPTTAWNTPFVGVRRQWAEYVAAEPITFDHMDLQIVADGRHSVPTRLRVDVDNASTEVVVPPIEDRLGDENATVTVPIDLPELTGRRIRVTVADVREINTRNFFSTQPLLMPAAIAELGIPGLRQAPAPAQLPGECRTDLLAIDDEPFPVRIDGDSDTAATVEALRVTPCDPDDPGVTPTLDLSAGAHVVEAAPGEQTAVQLDRLVFGSAAGGEPIVADGDGHVLPATTATTPPNVEVVDNGRTKMKVEVSAADGPFWLVLGESQSPGWRATVEGQGSVGESQLVDGYANGWRIDPGDADTLAVTLEWVPQRRVWYSLALSIVGIVLALGIVVVSLVRRRSRSLALAGEGDVDLVWPFTPLGSGAPRWAYVVGPLVAGAAAAVIVAPWAGVLVALLVLLVLFFPPARAVLTLAPPVLLGLAALYIAGKQQRYELPPVFEWPTLFPRAETPAWLAMVLVAADGWIEWLRTRYPAPNDLSEQGESSGAAA